MRDAFDAIDYEVKPRKRIKLLAQAETKAWVEAMHTNGVFQGYTTNQRATLPASWCETNDMVVKNFHALQGEGYVILNPYDSTTVNHDCTTSNGTFILESGQTRNDYVNTGICEGLFRPYLFPVVPSPSDNRFDRARNEALVRVYSKAKAADVDLLVDLAELKGTVKLFQGLGTKFKRLIREVRLLSDISRASTAEWWRVYLNYQVRRFRLKDLSGLYLEARFGWGPLLGSLYGICEAIATMSGSEKARYTYRASEVATFEKEVVADRSVTVNGVVWPRFYRTAISQTSAFRAGILADVQHKWTSRLGLDWHYIPSALWDLVPYSFVVDRFLYVGNLLKAILPGPRSNTLSSAWLVERTSRLIKYEAEFLEKDGSSGSGPSYLRAYQPLIRNSYFINSNSTIRTLHTQPPITLPLKHDWAAYQSLVNLIDAVMLVVQRAIPRVR